MQQMPLLLRNRSAPTALLSALVLMLAPVLLRGQLQAAALQRITTSQAPPASTVPASTLPATRPTTQSTPPLNALPTPIAAPPASNRPPNRAEVSYSDGLLNVRADNSSLHQILRAISRSTGMTLTGDIADDRVFGNYGPAPASTVLATLIDGTGVNMLFQAGDATHPPSLVLTPQTGSPGLVNATPIAANADDAPVLPAAQPQQFPAAASPRYSPPAAATLPATSTTTTSTETGGNKTPEQIYQELLLMQQKQQQLQRPGQATPNSPVSTPQP